MSDPEVLAHSFKLSDAQELVARQQGFESWHALKQGISAMSGRSEQNNPETFITAAEPQLFVSDIKRSLDFFTRKLGFVITFSYGEPPFYAQVKRDAAVLNLRHVDHPVIDPERRDREDLLSAALTLSTPDAIKALFLEFQLANVPIVQALKSQPWGARNFIVSDPDGNLLLFASPANQ